MQQRLPLKERNAGLVKVKKSSSAIIVAILFIALVAVFLLQKNILSSVNRVSEQTALTLLSDNVN